MAYNIVKIQARKGKHQTVKKQNFVGDDALIVPQHNSIL